MRQFFYTDPLAAAWMAKHFGMEFIPALELFKDDRSIALVSVLGKQFESPTYLHPDSLRMLEPIMGDVVKHQDYYAVFDFIGYRIHNKHWQPVESEFRDGRYVTIGAKIIQRNGIAFHWPEKEE